MEKTELSLSIFEKRSIKMFQSEQQMGKLFIKNERRLRHLRNNIKRPNIYVIRIPEEKKMQCRKNFKEIMA